MARYCWRMGRPSHGIGTAGPLLGSRDGGYLFTRLRGRDQDAAKRWDEFMRRNGGSRDGDTKVRAN
jgi:hypothetical protein